MSEITREEKHALIVEKIEGFQTEKTATGHVYVVFEGWKCRDVPNYSADLNACFRAEAWIKGEAFDHYKGILLSRHGEDAVCASAEARVDAMAALIQSKNAR